MSQRGGDAISERSKAVVRQRGASPASIDLQQDAPAAQLDRVRAARRQQLDDRRNGSRCALAVVAAGFPRTGSTLQVQFIRAALESICAPVTKYAGTYYDLARHVGMDAAGALAYYEREAQTQARLWRDPQAVMLYKSHEFNPELLSLCRQVIAFTSNRCLNDSLWSAFARGWVQPTPESLESFIRSNMAHYTAWKSQGALDIEYAWMTEAPHRVFRLMTDFLALKRRRAHGDSARRGCWHVKDARALTRSLVSYPTPRGDGNSTASELAFGRALASACGRLKTELEHAGLSCCLDC